MECQIKTQFCTHCNGVKMLIGGQCGSCLKPIQEKESSNNDDDRCIQCNSLNVYIHEQEYSTVCEECGHVKNNNIKDTAEWTNYSGDSNRIVMSRCSMSTSLNLASSLGSYISNSKYGNFTVQGKYTDKETGVLVTFEKTISLSKLNIRQSKTNEENRYDHVIKYLNKFDWGRDIIGKSLLYWKVIKNSQYKGRVREAILALCVHYALCTIPGANHTPSYVCEKMNIPIKDFTKAKQIFPRYRLLTSNPLSKKSFNSSINNTISYHIVGKLKLPYKYYVPKCLEVHKLNKTKLQKKRFRPNTILFGVMYTVIKEKDKVIPKRIIKYLERYCSVYTMNNVYDEINN